MIRQLRMIIAIVLCVGLVGCIPELRRYEPQRTLPSAFGDPRDSVSLASVSWREYFNDSVLTASIDSALVHNQERNVTAEDVRITAAEALARRGEVLPTALVAAGVGAERAARYTRDGAAEEAIEIVPGRANSVPLADFTIGAAMTWEVDIWRKLRNAADAAELRMLAAGEGLHLITTEVVASVAETYYDLLALDEQLRVVDSTVVLLRTALHVVELQKISAKTTELAVQRFRAEVSSLLARRHALVQRIVEGENRLNVLLGRAPQRVDRVSAGFRLWAPDSMRVGRPDMLALNRPDVRRADLAMQAAALDVDVARASFYPSLHAVASGGLRSSDASLLMSTPESIALSALADLVLPIVNRSAIEAQYLAAGSRSNQAALVFEQVLVRAHNEVVTAASAVVNATAAYEDRKAQVAALLASIDVATNLFLSARADYMEVLLTQRDALEARLEFVETRLLQMKASVALYRALGGGWK